MDGFRRILHLIIPVLFCLTGVFAILTAVIGSPKSYEDNPKMQANLERFGKTKMRIIHALIGIGILAYGGWLLHGWLFVRQ
ncbi:MAG: hypothetical protein K6E36_04715 [Oscillospiraceae bacterium]|nr:hypothetical protein [Oscillospiraceae bacterium]MCR5305785.1 hypothetical protein [Oscillospiraceae bacterium]